jgi:hypothetical protein
MSRWTVFKRSIPAKAVWLNSGSSEDSVIKVSRRTVINALNFAKAWLHRDIVAIRHF